MRGKVSKVIIHAKAQIACLQPIVDTSDRVGAAAEVHVEIFNFRGPIGCKADFHTKATGPTDKCFAFVEAKKLAFKSAIGKTQAAKQQHIVDREAGTAAQRTKPRVGKFVRGESIIGSANLDICFGAENELSSLPIVTDLASASDAAWIDAAVRDLAPFIAEVETGI